MKNVNTNLMSAALVLISVLSITIRAAAIRNIKLKNTSTVILKSECASRLVGLKKYNGEWISVIQLPELNITESAVKGSR